MQNKNVAILVGGGPAPGINGVISSVTIEAINRGYKVLGISNGFEHLMVGDKSAVTELTVDRVSRIDGDGGTILGTSRANPKKSPEALQNVVRVLQELNVYYLVTIGGDDTASSAQVVASASEGKLAVGHVPKTIDNDLPLPGSVSTFGFQSAREQGARVVETLMIDAKATRRWYLVTAMGRKAGHLALGIGAACGATSTIIPEEFGGQTIALARLVNIISGSILKRFINGREYGVVVLAEGLAEILDPNSIPEIKGVELDPHGHVRFSELDFGRIVREAVRLRLQDFGVKVRVLDKDVGYELRCCPPTMFDREYTKLLGFGIIDFLLSGKSGGMICKDGGKVSAIPFADFIDSNTQRSKVRLVDIDSDEYKIARRYMIRMGAADFENREFCSKLESITKLSKSELIKVWGS